MPTLAERIQTLKSARKRIAFAALSRHEKEQKQRIFERGECSDGRPINAIVKAKTLDEDGQYSQRHGKARREFKPTPRRTDKLDLNLTGRHRRDLGVGEDSNGEVVYGFRTPRQREIAEKHEAYRKKPIYKSSSDEKELLLKATVAEAKQIIKEIFQR